MAGIWMSSTLGGDFKVSKNWHQHSVDTEKVVVINPIYSRRQKKLCITVILCPASCLKSLDCLFSWDNCHFSPNISFHSWLCELPFPPALTSCQSMPRPPNSVAIMMLAYETATQQSRKKKDGFKPSPHISLFERRSTMNHFINKPWKKYDLGENRVKPTKAPGSLDRKNNTLDEGTHTWMLGIQELPQRSRFALVWVAESFPTNQRSCITLQLLSVFGVDSSEFI